MNAAPTSSHRESRRAIAAHFAGRVSPAEEAAMRAHLLECADCRTYYQHHLVLGRLDPSALSVKDRIARGLGLRRERPVRRPASWIAAGLVVSSAAAIVLLVRPDRPIHVRDLASGPPAFAVRGGEGPGARAPSFWIYRLGPERQVQLVEDTIARGDELAFAYANPTGKRYLVMFGVDERRRVYWFHPAWPRGGKVPSAVPAQRGPGPYELPEAVRHELGEGRLMVHALFVDRRIDVETLEARLRARPSWQAAPAMVGDERAEVVSRLLLVRP